MECRVSESNFFPCFKLVLPRLLRSGFVQTVVVDDFLVPSSSSRIFSFFSGELPNQVVELDFCIRPLARRGRAVNQPRPRPMNGPLKVQLRLSLTLQLRLIAAGHKQEIHCGLAPW